MSPRPDGAWNGVKSEGEDGVLTLLSIENEYSALFIGYIETRVRNGTFTFDEAASRKGHVNIR